MKKHLIGVALMLGSLTFLGQEVNKCALTQLINKKSAEDPSFAAKVEEVKERNSNLSRFRTTNSTVYKIPVVFHILHQGGLENISNAQIEDAVRILNIDFRKLNADTVDIVPEFKQIAADIEIEFALATIDPDGNCTNGIIRHYTSATNFDASYSYTGVGPGLWDPQKYLNFYICRTLDFPGAAAYTYIPGWLGAGNPADAVVSLHNYVGSIGTSSPFTSRVLTHEVGHWLGLDHVWGGTNDPGVACGDDGVSDTPITKGFSSCMLQSAQICTPGVTENVQNYMEYSYCDRMFTLGQKNLMRNVIATGANAGRDILVSAANLIATGITNPMVCAPVADFKTTNNKVNYCAGQTVQFADNTQNAHPTSWNWSFPGGVPSSSADSMPQVLYASPGMYAVSYTATNSAGNSSVSKVNYIVVSSNTAAYSGNFTESFETMPALWYTGTSNDGNTWTQTNTAAVTGTHCLMINNFSNTIGDTEVVYTPGFDLSSINAGSGVSFTFKLAYQQKNSSSAEKLQVFSSTNCGQTWSPRYSKQGAALNTTGSFNASAFVPSAASEWRTETVSVSALSGQQNVYFKFVFNSDHAGDANNIYIDDINIVSNSVGLDNTVLIPENINIYPNPSHGISNLVANLALNTDVEIILTDVLGKRIQVIASEKAVAGEHSYQINTTGMMPGVYFINCTVNGMTVFKKLVVE